MNIKSFFSYFNPFSEFQVREKFWNLERSQQGLTVTLTALAVLATIPLLGLGGLAVFRAMVGHYTIIDPDAPGDAVNEQTAAKTHIAALPVIHSEVHPVINNDSPTKKELKDLDTLTEAEVKAFVSEVNKKQREEDEEGLKELHQRYMTQFEKMKNKAIVLHSTFSAKVRDLGEESPETSECGITTVTLTQFKVVQRMLRKEFPNFTSLPFNSEQKCAVARLMQLIMCGGQIKQLELPKCPEIFVIRELKDKSSPVVIEEKEFFLQEFLKIIRTKQSLKSNFLHAVELFVRDCFARTLNVFEIDSKRKTQLGGDIPDLAKVVALIRDQLTDEFSEDSSKLKRMILEAKAEGSIVKLLNQWFLVKGDELLSESLMEEVLKKVRISYCNDKDITKALDNFIMYCRIDEKDVTNLHKSSGCTITDIRSLVRIRVLQMILLMNQSFQADGCTRLFELLNSNIDDGSFLSATGEKGLFVASPGVSLQNMESRVQYSIYTAVSNPKEFPGHFDQNRVNLALITTTDKMEHFSSGMTKREIRSIAHLQVSWQINESILDRLVKLISPGTVANQPKEKCKELKEVLRKGQSDLDELNNRVSEQISEKMGFNWLWSQVVDSPLKVQSISTVINQVVKHCFDYMRVMAFDEGDSTDSRLLLKGTMGKLMQTSTKLSELRSKYENSQEVAQAVAVKAVQDKVNETVRNIGDKI